MARNTGSPQPPRPGPAPRPRQRAPALVSEADTRPPSGRRGEAKTECSFSLPLSHGGLRSHGPWDSGAESHKRHSSESMGLGVSEAAPTLCRGQNLSRVTAGTLGKAEQQFSSYCGALC